MKNLVNAFGLLPSIEVHGLSLRLDTGKRLIIRSNVPALLQAKEKANCESPSDLVAAHYLRMLKLSTIWSDNYQENAPLQLASATERGRLNGTATSPREGRD